jgi:hypothetical protein
LSSDGIAWVFPSFSLFMYRNSISRYGVAERSFARSNVVGTAPNSNMYKREHRIRVVSHTCDEDQSDIPKLNSNTVRTLLHIRVTACDFCTSADLLGASRQKHQTPPHYRTALASTQPCTSAFTTSSSPLSTRQSTTTLPPTHFSLPPILHPHLCVY